MTKKRKRILIWFTLWAGLLIVVLYSPIGSPGLYSSQNYFVAYQPVIVNNGMILITPKAKYSTENNDNELDMPGISSELTSKYSTGKYYSGSTSSGGSSYGIMQTQSYHNNYSGSGNMGGSGTFIARNGSRSSSGSSGSSGITMINGLTAIASSSDLTTVNKKSILVADPPPTSGGTDPGDDPTGAPIPVGDGWGLLVLFGGTYIFVKIKLKLKSFTIL